MAFRLFTTYHRSDNEQRQQELDACLDANCALFDSVTVLAESCPRPEWFLGAHWFEGVERQTYADLLALAANCEPSDVVVIANADIAFSVPSEPLSREQLDQIEANLQAGQVYALSRWDVLKNHIKLFDKRWSQDSWVFRGPPKQNIGGRYKLGCSPGCDNRFAHELQAAGYEVLNPSKDIRTYHLHQSGYRPGNNDPSLRVPLPYLYVEPAHLGEPPSYERPTKASKRVSSFQV